MSSKKFPIFLSIVLSIKDESDRIKYFLQQIIDSVQNIVDDFEIIVVDNASTDSTLSILKQITSKDGLPNIQVFSLTKEVDYEITSFVGIENSLGDFVLVYDPLLDDLSIVTKMLELSSSGNDVVFASNQIKSKHPFSYQIANNFFNFIFKKINGINLNKETPNFRIYSKSLINFLLQHNDPATCFRHLPATAGFKKSYLKYSALQKFHRPKKIKESIEKGIRLMISTTRLPMRLVTFFSLFGASINFIYSLYVLFVALFFENIAPGWISMSLQMSGMFFLISLVLLVLSEYILHIGNITHKKPLYHVSQEFTSEKILRQDRLNIENVTNP